MQSNREVFFEQRESEADIVPPVIEEEELSEFLSDYKAELLPIDIIDPTETQSYHNRLRVEDESVLMPGGYYFYNDGNIWFYFKLKEYSFNYYDGFLLKMWRSYHYTGKTEFKTKIFIQSLRFIRPMNHEEQEKMENINIDSSLSDWFNNRYEMELATKGNKMLGSISKAALESYKHKENEKESK